VAQFASLRSTSPTLPISANSTLATGASDLISLYGWIVAVANTTR
jgi:cytochrome P450